MRNLGTIRIGEYRVEIAKRKIQRLKTIFDKLEIPHVLDDVSFHNTFIDLCRIKSLYHTTVWKVEKDGSVHLRNRFGHSGRFENRHLFIKSLLEFQFVDLAILTNDETEFLSDLIYEFEFLSNLSETAGEYLLAESLPSDLI
jgi:hypothetical protein